MFHIIDQIKVSIKGMVWIRHCPLCMEITLTVPCNNMNPTKKHLDRDEVDEDQLLILLHPLITFLKCISGWITQFKSMLYL